MDRRRQEGYAPQLTVGSRPWVKAEPIYRRLRELPPGIVVVSDADVWCDISAAVAAVEAGAPWAVPHDLLFRLTQEATARLLETDEIDWDSLEQKPYRGFEGGGILVAHRDTLLDVPPDQRFVGWGHEDECWALALRELVGESWRGSENLVHLWHPPQERRTRNHGRLESWMLKIDYCDARGHPEAMRALVEEGRPCSPSSSTALA